jgi:hypothetical protein
LELEGERLKWALEEVVAVVEGVSKQGVVEGERPKLELEGLHEGTLSCRELVVVEEEEEVEGVESRLVEEAELGSSQWCRERLELGVEEEVEVGPSLVVEGLGNKSSCTPSRVGHIHHNTLVAFVLEVGVARMLVLA